MQEPITWWLDAVRRDAAAVLDVRAAACFAAGHLAGAVSWPLEAGWQAQPPGRDTRASPRAASSGPST